MFGPALIDRQLRRGAALLALSAVFGGCGGVDDADDRKPVKIRVSGGKISSDRLQESPTERRADDVQHRGPVSGSRP